MQNIPINNASVQLQTITNNSITNKYVTISICILHITLFIFFVTFITFSRHFFFFWIINSPEEVVK